MLRADLHIHTCYSMDCSTSLEALFRRCQQRGITCIAITDHGTCAGGLRAREIAPFQVVVSQEVLTKEGEILGFFLEKDIPTGLTAREAVARIREQGGVVGVPHPFDQMARSSLGPEQIEALLPEIQVVEGFNARSLRPQDQVMDFGRSHGLALSAGSDAHSLWEVGNAYIDMPPFSTPQQFVASLSKGTIGGHHTPLWVHGVSAWEHLLLRLKGKKSGKTSA
ncbi:MAG: PHP-associated domain-containing protein [Dehalococcoidia bacterium]|nr:PHP-associated domain-containing protein [Dehalococcoidia bacterium]MDP6510699.1 PHP-associated domain-containing protein [Dehalococcoidia bacterium]